MPGTPALRWLLPLVLCASLGMTCGLQGIVVDAPAADELVTLPDANLRVRLGRNVDPSSVEVFIDGVGLFAALGLTPPILGASGVVSIGGTPVTVSDLTFDPSGLGVRVITGVVSGLGSGPHVLEVTGFDPGAGSPVDAVRDFAHAGPFTHPVGAFVSRTHPAVAPLASGGSLAHGALGAPLAAPPVSSPGSGSLRSGLTPAAEAYAQGENP